MTVLESVVAGLITKAITDLGARLAGGAVKIKGKHAEIDLELASFMASSEVIESLDPIDVTRALSLTVEPSLVATALKSVEVASLVHELLALNLLRDPQFRVDSIRESFTQLLRIKLRPQEERDVDRISSVLFQYLDERCKEVTDQVYSGKPDVIERIRTNASYSLIRNTLEAIERHSEALANQGLLHSGEIDKFAASYRRQVVAKHGHIVLPDFERKQKFPIEDLYVDARLVLADMGRVVERTLTGVQDEIDRTVILGDPGGGKSTAAAVLAYRLAQSASEMIPFLIVLRDFPARDDSDKSVLQFIEDKVNSIYQIRPAEGVVEMLLLSGRAVVIFDGLDELIDTSKRREVTDIVEMFCSRYPLAKVLVTSREVGYEQAPVDEHTFRVMRITRFKDEQVCEYVENWFRRAAPDEQTSPADLAKSFMQESRVVADLRGNPLLLSLMCIMYRGEKYIPRNRPELYEKCATMLFDKWDSHRNIYVDVEVAHLVDVSLKHLAWWIFTKESSQEGVPEGALIDETARYLRESSYEQDERARRAAKQFITFCKGRAWVFSDAGSTAEGEPLYKFTHRTFLEYFAAFELSRRSTSSERLARQILPHVAKGEWDVVSQLAVQIENKNRSNGANRIFETIINEKIKRATEGRFNVLNFLCRCLEFHAPPPVMVREIVRRAVDMAFELRASEVRESVEQIGRVAPIHHLFNSSSNYSIDVIQDQLTIELNSRLTSVETKVRESAWFMLLGLPTNRIASSRSDFWIETNRARWMKWREDLVTANRDTLESDSIRNPDIRAAAIYEGFSDIFVATEIDGSGGTPLDKFLTLFNDSPNDFYSFVRIPPALWIPRFSKNLADPEDDLMVARRRSFLGQIDPVLPNLPSPPWISRQVVQKSRTWVRASRKSEEHGRFEDEFFIAAALLLLPYFEGTVARRTKGRRKFAATDKEMEDDLEMTSLLGDERLKALANNRLGIPSDLSFLSDFDKWASDLLSRWAAGQTDFVY